MHAHPLRSLTALAASAALLAACAGGPPPLPRGEAIGTAIAPAAPLALAEVLASPGRYTDRTLLVGATVAAVCQSKGCWMQLEDHGQTAMVRWESGCGGQYAFPKDAIGRRVLVQGSFYAKELSEADARHLEAESGGKTMPRQTYEMNASAVLIVAE